MVAIATYSAWHKNGGMALDEEEKHSVCSLLSSRFGLLVQLLLNVMVNGAGHVAHNVFHHENKILHGLAIKGTTNGAAITVGLKKNSAHVGMEDTNLANVPTHTNSFGSIPQMSLL